MVAPDSLLATLVDQLQIGVVAVDVADRIMLWNVEAHRLTGYSAEEALGTLGTELVVAAEDRPLAEEQRAHLLAGQPWSGEFPVRRKDGRMVPMRFRARAVLDPAGTPVAIVGAFDDASGYQRREEAFALLDALFETAPVGLAYFDVQGRYRRVNRATVAMSGGAAEEYLGRAVTAVHGDPVGTQIAAAVREVVASGQPRHGVRIAGRSLHGRGEDQVWTMSFYPVRASDGRLLGVGDVLRNITAEERTARELAELAAARQRTLDRYLSLIEATSAAVWTRNPDGAAEEDSPSWRAITGQSEQEYLGWGFLDAVHPDDRAEKLHSWQTAVASGNVYNRVHRLRTVERGYRYFRARAVPVTTAGRVVEWVGAETDIDDEVRARSRLDVLARATAAVNADLNPEAELAALAAAVVPDFADACAVHLLDYPEDAPGQFGRRLVALVGKVPTKVLRDRVVQPLGDDPLSQAIRQRSPVLVHYPLPAGNAWAEHPLLQNWIAELGLHSALIAPVFSDGQVVAALSFAACGDRPRFSQADLSFVTELAAHASTAVEHGHRFQQTRAAAITLQMAMLTDPLAHPNLEIEARYQPADDALQVGGDWYDTFPLPDGDLGIAVGDVAGHDLAAATTMGQLRSMLRALAYDDADPAAVLTRLDRLAIDLQITSFTSLLYGRLHHDPGTARTDLTWSNAGHPPPLLIDADGSAQPLFDGAGLVLGVDRHLPRRSAKVAIPRCATLLLYTDGLVERRRYSIDEGLHQLTTIIRTAATLPLKSFCDELLVRRSQGTDDDIALLALRPVR
jgi:PAS domain S-box-containing protein